VISCRLRTASHQPAALWMRDVLHSFPFGAFDLIAFQHMPFPRICQPVFDKNFKKLLPETKFVGF
jgi:hypothetical protein